MKRTLLLLLYFLTTTVGLAQFTAIPDSNFEQALIDQGIDLNTTIDGQVLTSAIENITFLNLTGDNNFNINQNEIGLNITDLTGIKDFISLEILWVQGNNLVELDLEGLSAILDIRAFYNDIENLNITGLINLDIIGIDFNNISTVDVSTNTSLRIFDIANNALVGLDISGLSALTNMNVQDNPQLSCINVESATRATSLNNNSDFRKNGTTIFDANCPSIYTLIPDVNLEQSLLDQGIDSEGGLPNGRVLTSDITPITILDISNEGINDLTGIEDFTSLQNLNVSFNNLNSLPLQNNTLQIIRANECNLGGKQISFINNGTVLTNVSTLELQNNNIGNGAPISFTGVPNVTYLDVRYNNFSSITSLATLSQLSNLNVAFCNLNSIDTSGNGLLSSLYIFGNNLTNLNTNSNNSLTQLLAGGNNLTSVSITNNQLLTILDLSDNNLSTITLPQTTTLQELTVYTNNLSSLDISNADANLTTLNTTDNSSLSCIQVSNVANAEAQGNWIKDAATIYSLDCSVTNAFDVAVDLVGAGNSPNYEITEGNTFTLNFEADNTATNGTQFTPNIEFSINGTSTTQDFRFNGNETNIPNNPFTVSAVDPDGSITITAFDDGVVEGDEVYTITITSPDTNSFTIIEPATFTVTVKDKGTIYTGPLSIRTSLSNAGVQPYFEVEEGSTFNLDINAENATNFGDSYQLEIEFSTYKIGPSENVDIPNFRELVPAGDILLSNEETDNTYDFIITQNQIDGTLQFTVVDDIINENVEEVVITVKTTQANQTVSINTFILKIKASDPVEIEVGLVNAGTAGNYLIEEGSEFELTASILGETEESFDFLISDNLSTATTEEDYSFNAQQTVYSYSFDPDLRASITVYLDSIMDNAENIILKLPEPNGNYIWKDADQNGELQFEIDIQDKDFVVSPQITNITVGQDGFYEVEEGTEISINLNPINLSSDVSFKNIPLLINTINNTAEEGIDFELISSQFLFQFNQEILIKTIIDGIQEQAETLEIRLPKPLANYEWENANADGSISFLIRIIDKDLEGATENYNLQLLAESVTINEFGDEEYLETILEIDNGVYKIKDNERLLIQIASTTNNNSKGLRINTQNGSAIQDLDFFSYELNKNDFFTSSYYSSINFTSIGSNNPNKTFALDILPTTNNYVLNAPNGTPINYPETITLNFEIESTDKRVTQEIITEIIGGEENLYDQDAIVSEYLAQENDTITILLSSRKPNQNNGAVYNMGFLIDSQTSTLTPDDYNLIIEDSEGNDMGNTLNNYTVNNNSPYDAKITIILLEDSEPEVTEVLSFSLVPDVTFGNFGSITNFRTKLANAQGPDQKQYRILVSEPGSPSAVYAVLSNTGSTEGTNEPDVITCTLYNSDNTPFISHTSTIDIPYEFVEYDGAEALKLLEDEFNPDKLSFTFPPGENEASINVIYDNELDVNDIDCDYYYISLKESPTSLSNNIIFSKIDYLVKVADQSEFLIFVDLDISNTKRIRPIYRNRHPNDDYELGFGGIRQSIERYEVEENTPLNFSIDAAKPVTEGKGYLLNILFPDSRSAKFQTDYTYNNGDKTTNLPVVVLKDEIDYEAGFLIEADLEDDSGETFTVTFQEPKYEKLYRFSKKDSRSYDQSYTFTILDALPVKIESNNTSPINEELPLESNGEFIISIDRSKENERNYLEIEFEISGDATFGGQNSDYVIESENKFTMLQGNKGILYVDKNDTEIKLKVTPINDPLAEGDETITLKLIDAFGYFLNVNEASSLTITDDDEADYVAYFKNEITTLFENNESTNEGELIFTLDYPNSTDAEIRIDFSIGQEEGSATFNEDYKLYYLNTLNERTEISVLENLYITIPIGEQEGRLIIEILEDTLYDEIDELISITIDDSEFYETQDPSTNNIVIKNEGEDGTSTISIFAEVISSSCEGENNGRIGLTNRSNYTFNAIISNENGILTDKTTELAPTNESQEIISTFSNLAPGTYIIFLEYIGNLPLPLNYIPPSFELTIRNPSDPILIGATIDEGFRIAKLQVEGSSSYEVVRNNEVFKFNVGSTNKTTLEIPMTNGLNSFEIKGESNCQNSIETNLFLDVLSPYPNPTDHMIYLGGFQDVNSTIISIYDLTGKMVVSEENKEIKNGVLEIDLTELSNGVYILHIKMQNGPSLDLKIVKK